MITQTRNHTSASETILISITILTLQVHAIRVYIVVWGLCSPECESTVLVNEYKGSI